MTQPNTSFPSTKQEPGFIKVSTGTVISGGMAYLFIRLLMSILHNLPPIAVDGSPLARSISIGVRYMLVGSIGLMAFMFSVVTIGLFAYSIQLAWQGLSRGKASDATSAPSLSGIVAEESEEADRSNSSSSVDSLEAASDGVDDSSLPEVAG